MGSSQYSDRCLGNLQLPKHVILRGFRYKELVVQYLSSTKLHSFSKRNNFLNNSICLERKSHAADLFSSHIGL